MPSPDPFADALPLSPEMRALLARARRRITGAASEAESRTRSGAESGAESGADPHLLARLAARHGLEALVSPEPGESGERATALEAVAGNLTRIRELHRVLNVLDAENVPILALKGPTLAVQAWGDVSARTYGDVDVLVPPDASDATVRALEAAGYVDRRGAHGRTPSPEAWHDWSFTAPDGRTLVEVHWSLVSPLRYPFVTSDEAWHPTARETVPLPGGTVAALRPEVQLPYLAIHASNHHWGWLEFPLTLAALARRAGDDLDWPALQERARRWHVRRIVAVALILAEELLGREVVALPGEVRARVRGDAGAVVLARWYARNLLLDPDSEWYRGSPTLWWRALQLRDSPGERMRAGWQYLFAPTTSEWVPPDRAGAGPSWPGPLRRVARLLRRYRTNR